MGRKNKQALLKSPFKLRKRKLTDGRESLFIDHIHEGRHTYTFLSLYLLPGTSRRTERHNKRVLAEAQQEIQRREALHLTTCATTRPAEPPALCEYVDSLINLYRDTGKKGASHLLTVRGNLEKFAPGIRIDMADTDFCRRYADWLKNDFVTQTGKRPSAKTTFGYFRQLGLILSNAYKAGIITKNPWERLSRSDKLREPERNAAYLTLADLRRLMLTPCAYPNIGRAFLFACFSGLRVSDIRSLQWKNLKLYNNKVWHVEISVKKTSKPLVLPLPLKAFEFLPPRGSANSAVFADLQSHSRVSKHLRDWGKEAGLNLNLHFHTARHTFATMLITAGTDVYTVGKLLGHSDVKTTMGYARIVDKKKREAMDALDNLVKRIDSCKKI